MKITPLCTCIGWLLLVSAGSSHAQTGLDPKASVGTTPRILADIETARKAKDKKLDAAFQKAIRSIEKSGSISQGRAGMITANLKATQNAWQDFRTKQCEFLYSYYYEEIGSPGARAAGIWEYESHLMDQRIKELEDPLNFF